MRLGSFDPSAIIFWSLILMAAILLLFVLVIWIKRRVQQPDQGQPFGFTLDDLRRMHEQGQLSEEEFERARTRLRAKLKSAVAKPQEPPKP